MPYSKSVVSKVYCAHLVCRRLFGERIYRVKIYRTVHILKPDHNVEDVDNRRAASKFLVYNIEGLNRRKWLRR